jgi:hypothetical protein
MRAIQDGRTYSYAALPVRRKWPFRRVVRSAFVLGLEAAAAFALVSAISTPSSAPAHVPPSPLDVEAVAAAPADYRTAEVTVAGRIRPRPERVSKQDRRAFVLEGTHDGRLLVVPADDAKLPGYRAGTKVIVRGTIVIPPASSRLANRVASRTAVAHRARAAAILKATEVEVQP